MSDVISVLEELGSNASLRHRASKEEILALLAKTSANDAVKEAVLNGDRASLIVHAIDDGRPKKLPHAGTDTQCPNISGDWDDEDEQDEQTDDTKETRR